MLQDRINNQLGIVLLSVSERRGSESANERELLEAAIAATQTVSRVLEELSLETLLSWKAKYGMDEIPTSTIPPVRAAPQPATRRLT
jgi:hypothetical protein